MCRPQNSFDYTSTQCRVQVKNHQLVQKIILSFQWSSEGYKYLKAIQINFKNYYIDVFHRFSPFLGHSIEFRMCLKIRKCVKMAEIR